MISPTYNLQIKYMVDRLYEADNYLDIAEKTWQILSSGHQEQLIQLLFQGPVWDGNVISKSYRDDLINYGLAVRCCFMGEQGYTAATYAAHTVFEEGGGKPVTKKPGSPG